MNKAQKEEQVVYGVIVFRTDGQHVVVLENPNFDVCYAEWEKLHEAWTTSVKEQQPFKLTSPVVTAFSPSMIYEIKLLPTNTQQNVSKSHNPYYNAMNTNGFSQTFPTSGAVDLLNR